MHRTHVPASAMIWVAARCQSQMLTSVSLIVTIQAFLFLMNILEMVIKYFRSKIWVLTFSEAVLQTELHLLDSLMHL